MIEKYDHEVQSDAVCPKCGHIEEREYGLGVGDTTLNKCSNCKTQYEILGCIKVFYSTRLIKPKGGEA